MLTDLSSTNYFCSIRSNMMIDPSRFTFYTYLRFFKKIKKFVHTKKKNSNIVRSSKLGSESRLDFWLTRKIKNSVNKTAKKFISNGISKKKKNFFFLLRRILNNGGRHDGRDRGEQM